MPENFYRDLKDCLAQARVCLQDLTLRGETYLDLFDQSTSDARCSLGGSAHCHLDGSSCGPETLETIQKELEDCRRCPLCQERTRIVFGVGNPEAKLVFVGEAPGREEDLQGEPFVGEAGKLLDRMLFAMGHSRESVYICNVEKCRPPKNRDPRPEEIEACEPYLKRQLAVIEPRVIVALGRFAAQTLLKDETPISRLRGRWHRYEGIALMPTFHPSYLLRNPASKHQAWEDLKQVMQKLRSEDT